MRRFIILFLTLLFVFNLSAKKGDSTAAIPDVLKPWQEWVLNGFEPQLCPSSFDDANATKCSWSSPLELKITNSRAQFSQSWTLYADSWITLPGSVEQWPKQVLSSGKPLLITKKSEVPSIFLKKGVHHIKGIIEWESRPKSLLIPVTTPFISLSVDGKKIESVNRDKEGVLWFTTKTKVVESTDEVQISVFRNVIDEIPLIIASEIHLSVSGKEREITVGRFLPENSIAMNLKSALPAKIEKDGNIKIRIKAGKWKIRLISRQNSFVNSFTMKKNTDNWPNQEVWVFSANSSLRDASVTGVVSIDTSQTNIPTEWKSLPAFLVTEKVSFTIKEEMRGDSHPAPDQIGISRTFWLDFDGKGFTVKDSVAGILNKNRRLKMSDGYKMGSVSVAGTPQLITKIGDKKEAIELRQGRLDLQALGRYTKASGPIPATGWSTDVTNLSAVVNLPPGWSVLYATGVDTITNSWVEKWTVWDMFLLFIIAVLVGKLMTKPWGVVAFLTILLTYHDSSAPMISWFIVIAVLTLIKLIPDEKLKKLKQLLTLLFYLTMAILIFDSILFSVEQIRTAIYPQLEHEQDINMGIVSRYDSYDKRAPVEYEKKVRLQEPQGKIAPASQMRKSLGEEGRVATNKDRTANIQGSAKDLDASVVGDSENVIRVRGFGSGGRGGIQAGAVQKNNRESQSWNINQNEKIQTGPGEPTWRWNQVNLRWSGPVTKDHTFSLVLLSPLLNKILNFSKVLLMLILLIKLILFNLGMSLQQVRKMVTNSKKVMIVPLLILFALPLTLRAEIPSDTLLQELKTRLQKERIDEKVDCFPDCVSMVKGVVAVGEKQITIQLDFDSFSDLYIPLPRYKQWYPQSITVNNKKGILRFDNEVERVSVLLSKGKNRIIVKGPLFGNSIQLSFPFEIHNLKVNAEAWSVSGLVDGNVPGGTVQFDKQIKQVISESDNTLLPDPIDPFLEISRTIILRNDWEVHTTARRIVPHEGPINLSIPLITGESVTTEDVRVSDGKVEITMGGFQNEFSWHSRLKKEDKIALLADKDLTWREIWSVDASPKWHIETSGLAKLKLQNRQVPVWKPRPGEKLTIAVSKPKSVTGDTKTIESAILNYAPGASSGTVVLTLGIKSSIGDTIKIKLPKDARLEKMIIDSVERILSHKNGEITLPLHPGKQTVSLHWKEMSPFSFMKRTPLINLNGKTSNIDIKFSVPRSRWVLFVGGPPIGPAMLIWGLMIVLLIVAFVLGRFKSLPIKSYEWALLFIGMGTVANYGVALIVIWFIAMAKRASYHNKLSASTFNFMQLVLMLLTLSAVISLIITIPMGLLSTPDMQIVGNGSSSYLLHWYQDHSVGVLPQGFVLSLPMWTFRLFMLLWSLWLAFRLPSWGKWAWNAFSAGEIWMKYEKWVKDETPKKHKKIIRKVESRDDPT